MSTGAATIFAQDYVKGFMDMITTMVSAEAGFTVNAVSDLSPDRLESLVSQFGAVMYANVKEGGAIALLFASEDLYRIAAAFLGEGPEPKDPLAAEDAPGLLEVYENCLGAGVSVFKEKYGKVLTLENHTIIPGGAQSSSVLSGLLGDACYQADFAYTVPAGAQGEAVLLISRNLEQTIPEEEAAKVGGSGNQMAQEGVNEILNTVGIKQPESGGGSGGVSASVPPNIERVLDIRLVAKARLGQVEMPINEILSLGPGSIIEVGHLVDEPIELLVNDKLIARGDVVVVDEKFGLRITEIISPRERIETLR